MGFLQSGLPERFERVHLSYRIDGRIGKKSFTCIDKELFVDILFDLFEEMPFVSSCEITSNVGEFLCESNMGIISIFQKDFSGRDWEDKPIEIFS